MGKKIRIGIVGAGTIGSVHAEAYKKVADAELVGLCDILPDKLKEKAAKHGIPKTYATHQEMLADPEISVNLFFNRPDREKQFLYKLLTQEPDPEAAMENFRQCLARINSKENYDIFLNSGFNVLLRDENRTVAETAALAGQYFKL